MLMVSRPRHVRREPHDLTDGELAGRVYRLARCAGSRVDPDDWFPVTRDVAKARDQATHAIAVCARCPVRPDCLELSLRHAFGVGAHGVGGGLVEEKTPVRYQRVIITDPPASSACGLQASLPAAAAVRITRSASLRAAAMNYMGW